MYLLKSIIEVFDSSSLLLNIVIPSVLFCEMSIFSAKRVCLPSYFTLPHNSAPVSFQGRSHQF